MLEIAVHASGSSGNCYTVTDGRTTVMLDCGLPYRRIQQLTGFQHPDAVFITHEHNDHIKAAKDFMKKGVDVYMSRGTMEAAGLEKSHRLNILKNRQSVSIEGIVVSAFDTQHDAVEPLGFLIDDGDDRILYATDTYYLHYKFPGLTKIMIEANYSEPILEENVYRGSVPEKLRKRLRQSHFSLENLKGFFKENDLSKVKEIWLIHLSNGNADPVRFRNEIETLTGRPVYVAGID
jgi:phosphoribosyl 1,2-cyclic phosphodiesterase